jgi:hypothetical protein
VPSVGTMITLYIQPPGIALVQGAMRHRRWTISAAPAGFRVGGALIFCQRFPVLGAAKRARGCQRVLS